MNHGLLFGQRAKAIILEPSLQERQEDAWFKVLSICKSDLVDQTSDFKEQEPLREELRKLALWFFQEQDYRAKTKAFVVADFSVLSKQDDDAIHKLVWLMSVAPTNLEIVRAKVESKFREMMIHKLADNLDEAAIQRISGKHYANFRNQLGAPVLQTLDQRTINHIVGEWFRAGFVKDFTGFERECIAEHRKNAAKNKQGVTGNIRVIK